MEITPQLPIQNNKGVMTVSRKWERMVEKNRKSVNKTRKKQGRTEIGNSGGSSREPMVAVKGRSWIMPVILMAVALIYFVSFYGQYPNDGMFWFTGFSYIGLSVLIFLFRRPVIRIGRSTLSVRRYSGDRTVEARQIKELTVSPSSVVIDTNVHKGKWTYTRFQHRFPMDELQAKLKEFALHNQVAFKEESK